MHAVTRAKLTLRESQPRSAIPFNLSPDMQITSASVDGRPAEVFDRTSLRSNLIQSGEDRQFLLMVNPPLDPAVPHEVEIHHEGAVIHDAGNQVYYVGSRGTWYPRSGSELANYELTFRYPKGLTVAGHGNARGGSCGRRVAHYTHQDRHAGPIRGFQPRQLPVGGARA